MNKLDFVVIATVLGVIIWAIICGIAYDYNAGRYFQPQPVLFDYCFAAGGIVQALTIAVLVTWLFHGGADSKVWKFLPPFCFFFWLGYLGRIIFLTVLILNCLIGYIKFNI